MSIQPTHRRRDPVDVIVLAAADLCTCTVGVLTLISTPPSVQAFGGVGSVYAVLWPLLLVLGALGNIATIRRPNAIPCCLVAAGWVLWAVAALTQPERTPTSLAVAAAFVALALLHVVRARQAAARRPG